MDIQLQYIIIFQNRCKADESMVKL